MALSETELKAVLANPLFYDALSGEFTSHIDPQGRQHTLARIAFAALAKGEQMGDLGVSGLIDFQPSWAPEVTATISYSEDTEGQFTNIGSLWLRSYGERRSLHVSNAYLCSGNRGVYLDTGSTTHELPLSLGDELNTARAKVTQNAQRFFDAV